MSKSVFSACLIFSAVLLQSCATATAASDTSSATAGATAASSKSLYERLGGMDAIKAVVSDFIDSTASDPRVSNFFGKTDAKYLKGQISDLLCEASGGPCKYTGMSMKDAHSGRGIQGAHFDVVAEHLVKTLDKYKVPEKEKSEVLALVGPMKGDIAEQK